MKVLWTVTFLLFAMVFPGLTHSAEPEPPIILISFDGFRWDYAARASTPTLDSIAASGIRAEGLIPVFPSKTFPSHYSIVTGLYPENHGIVSNIIYDPEFDAVFTLSNREEVENTRWWGGEPIWVTAQKQGLISATLFWPGSEASVQGVRPTHWRKFDAKMSYEARVDQVLNWLDLPAPERPSLITLYIEEVNEMGHRYGPDAPQVSTAIERVDNVLGRLITGLSERGLRDKTNLVIVSDHGMAQMDKRRVIYLDDFIDLDDSKVLQDGAILQLIPKPGSEHLIYSKLVNAHPRMKIYRRDDLPERLHLKNNSRVPPIVGIPDDGWLIMNRSKEARLHAHFVLGDHGHDPQHRSMHGIFYASGPGLKRDLVVERFESIHVYNLLTMLLNLHAATNDGNPELAKSFLNPN